MQSINLSQQQDTRIERTIARQTSRRTAADFLRKEVVPEHLCVRLVCSDLLDLLANGAALDAPMRTLPEASREQHEEGERGVTRAREANAPAKEAQSNGRGVEKLGGHLGAGSLPRSGQGPNIH